MGIAFLAFNSRSVNRSNINSEFPHTPQSIGLTVSCLISLCVVAPTIALGLQLPILLGSSPEKLLVLSSAGATPGNAAFASAFADAFPVTAEFNADLFNTLDIVPQAFGTDPYADRKLSNITHIYSDVVVENWFVRAIVKGLYGWVNDGLVKNSMPHAPIPGRAFTPGDPIPPISTRKELLDAMLKEHVEEYFDHWGIREFVNYLKELGKKHGLEDVEVSEDSLAEFEPKGEVLARESKGGELVVEEVSIAVVDL